mmetsp:Transcript_23754/g.35444  ORF Transcript_23754/g.35444 Transcript_23754/m.35444 type:complete len:93 (-) Transcript_23754:122-400(-)
MSGGNPPIDVDVVVEDDECGGGVILVLLAREEKERGAMTADDGGDNAFEIGADVVRVFRRIRRAAMVAADTTGRLLLAMMMGVMMLQKWICM